MKIKQEFVTNSSSTSYVVFICNFDGLEKEVVKTVLNDKERIMNFADFEAQEEPSKEEVENTIRILFNSLKKDNEITAIGECGGPNMGIISAIASILKKKRNGYILKEISSGPENDGLFNLSHKDVISIVENFNKTGVTSENKT